MIVVFQVPVENNSLFKLHEAVGAPDVEKVGGYRVDQQARECLQLIPQFGGTVGGIRRSLLVSLGGWSESMLAEDTDLTFRVSFAGFRICYVNDAECYEEAVETSRLLEAEIPVGFRSYAVCVQVLFKCVDEQATECSRETRWSLVAQLAFHACCCFVVMDHINPSIHS